jgi:small-conductance mechanosensitive channel
VRQEIIAMSSVPLIEYGLMCLGILVIIALGVLIYTLIRHSLHLLVQTQHLSEPILLPLLGFIRGTVVVVVILASLHQAGIQVTSVWAGVISAAAMLAGGFVALSSVMSNLLCTVLLLVFMPFRIGDEIEIIDATKPGGGLRGRVVDLNPFYASIQNTMDNGDRTSVVRVPNNVFFQKTVRRWQESGMVQ